MLVFVGIGVAVLVGEAVGAVVNVGVGVAGDACSHAERMTKGTMQATIWSFNFPALFIYTSCLLRKVPAQRFALPAGGGLGKSLRADKRHSVDNACKSRTVPPVRCTLC